ncbi:carboxypeptidase B2 [Clupea harengus]|uniref:Carboxypeptidase B2 n=1 Tax=Clupea harengus TaxID=7950 RepID=A0A6P3VI13_CLUHA|nr:carboxypeptidase B2 [Clupea harengus]
MKLQLLIVFVLSLDKFPEKCHSTTESGKVLSITASTPERVDILRNISSQFETVLWQPASPFHIMANSEVHLYVPRESVLTVTELLESNQLTHSLMVENTEELIEIQTRNDSSDPRTSVAYYERYHSLEDIYFWINKTTTDYANIVRLLLIGSSFEKRPLYVLKLSGKASNTPKKAIWIDCGIHAREWISPAFCLWFVDHCIKYYNESRDVTEMMDSMDIYVLPVLNPDGYRYTWTTKRMWRKNRSIHSNSGCVGVDLNRNFDANWCTSGASSNPCDDTYCGQYPESEPEAQAVANFLRSHKNTVQLYFSIHSYSQMLLFPYSCTHEQARNHDELYELVRDAAADIKRYYQNNYKYGPGSKTIYLAPGGSDDWAYNLGIDYSFTFELQDRGHYGFLLPPRLIAKACKEGLMAVKSISLKVIRKPQ